MQYDDVAAAATAVGCGHHGSFDPETHLTRDHATGVCRLEFVALSNSCDAALVVAGGGFGVMVEAPLSTDPDFHNHEHNEDNNHKDNNGMLLRFSTDAGATYYNNKDPRKTVPLDKSNSRRLQWTWQNVDAHPGCVTSSGTYQSHKDYCYLCGSGCMCWNSQTQCPPDWDDWSGVTGQDDGDCGEPCKEFLNEAICLY